MEKPHADIEDRQPIWDSMQMLFMDVDPFYEYDSIALTCASSKYTLEELESILFDEVFPACRFNLIDMPAPEWRGFDLDTLSKRILQKQRHGKRRLWMLRSYTQDCWAQLEPRIKALRTTKD